MKRWLSLVLVWALAIAASLLLAVAGPASANSLQPEHFIYDAPVDAAQSQTAERAGSVAPTVGLGSSLVSPAGSLGHNYD